MGIHYSLLDKLIINVDHALKTLAGHPVLTERPDPAAEKPETELSAQEKDISGRLMRINHAGEVSAQGLYQGQALTARLPEIRRQMERSAIEENDHLDWCERRCRDLGTHTSYLSPFWYAGSFTIGALAGSAGDKWSLGFVAETEHQVIKHLEDHLQKISDRDEKSIAVLQQMKEDEAQHAAFAEQSGGVKLPLPVKLAMRISSKVMTKTAYYL